MSEYTPDNWVILKLEMEDGEIIHKVLAGWSGGYLDGDSWKINSGITKIEDTENHFAVHGYSGSIYICRKNSQMLRMNSRGTYNWMKERLKDRVNIVPIKEILEKYS